MIIKSFTTFAIMTKLIKGMNNLFFKLYMFGFFFSQWGFFFSLILCLCLVLLFFFMGINFCVPILACGYTTVKYIFKICHL